MHSRGYVHGDVRLANIVFSKENSYLIDFDFVGRHKQTRYSGGYNSNLPERHEQAVTGNLMMYEHDRISLSYIINETCATSLANKRYISTMLTDPSKKLEDIAKVLDDIDN